MSENNSAGKIIKLGLILFTITAVTGLILGFVHEITAEPIAATQARLKNEALTGALPEADSFAPTDASFGEDDVVREVMTASANGEPVGWCVTVAPKGYAGKVVTVVGITKEGGLRAIKILSQSETPGLGAKAATPAFMGQYGDKNVPALTVVKGPPASPDQIQAISGATITSDAVTAGVNAALSYWRDNLRGSE